MYTIYSLCPAPWGDQYRFVESFDTKDDANMVLAALEKVNILFHCYTIVEEEVVYTNRRLRADIRKQDEMLAGAALEICGLKTEIDRLQSER